MHSRHSEMSGRRMDRHIYHARRLTGLFFPHAQLTFVDSHRREENLAGPLQQKRSCHCAAFSLGWYLGAHHRSYSMDLHRSHRAFVALGWTGVGGDARHRSRTLLSP